MKWNLRLLGRSKIGILNYYMLKFTKPSVGHMDVSKNRDTSKWMVKIMKNPIKIHYLGGTIIFGKKKHIRKPPSCSFFILVHCRRSGLGGHHPDTCLSDWKFGYGSHGGLSYQRWFGKSSGRL